jgi:hypothetical protein
MRAAANCSATAAMPVACPNCAPCWPRACAAIDPGLTAAYVLVTAGAQQALDLVLRTFCTAGDTVLVTSPSYHQMHGLLRAHGLQVVQVPLRADGVDLDALRTALQRRSVRLAYLMPTFHNPTGRTLDRAQRQALLAVFADTAVPIVEDEYQSDLRHRGEPLPTLRSLDRRGLTVTVQTMSKGLFPALRLGWITGRQGPARADGGGEALHGPRTEPAAAGGAGRVRAARRVRPLSRRAAPRTARAARSAAARGAGAPAPGARSRIPTAASSRGSNCRRPATAIASPSWPRNAACASCRAASSTCTGPLARCAPVADARRRAQIDAGLRVLGDCARELDRAPVAARPFL